MYDRGVRPATVLLLLTRIVEERIIRYMIVDSAIYVDGRRAVEPTSLQETYVVCRERHGLAWIGLYEPTEEEFSSMAQEFGLHPLAVEDAIKAHQRPKIERYDGTLFVVLRSARYIDETETVDFGEIHVFVGEDFVVTVRHGKASTLDRVRRRLESMPELLRRGPEAILYAVMDRVVDDYAPVVESLERDIDEIEVEVFSGNPGASRRIYELSREAIHFRRATAPLVEVLSNLIEDNAYQVDPEVRRYLRDVRDHALRLTDKVVALRELLHPGRGRRRLLDEHQPHPGEPLPERGGQKAYRIKHQADRRGIQADRRGEEDQRLGGHRDHTHAHSEHLRDEL